MADIFISYSSKDQEIADTLCSEIEKQGYSCWIAHRDIIPGEDWARSINAAITVSKVFIIIYSRNSCESTQVPKEIGIAGARNLPIIPFKIDDTPLAGDFEYYLLGCHWVAADPMRDDYKMTDVLAAIDCAVARREGREPSSVIINNNYAGDNRSVVNVNQISNSGKGLKIAVGIAVALLIAAIVIIVILLAGRGNVDGSSLTDISQNISGDSGVSVVLPDASLEEMTYYEADAIYSEMVYRLLQTASTNSYSGFVSCFDDTYTAAEIAELYSIIGYSAEMEKMHISMLEFTDDTIFGMYSFYENSYEGMPVHYHSDFVNEANVIVRDGDTWKFSRLSESHPLYGLIEERLYPYGTDTDDSYTFLTYQTAASMVLCDHCMVEVVNVTKNDDTLTVRFELINGDFGYPTELDIGITMFDYDGNLLLSVEDMAMDTNIASGEIQFYEIVSEPLESIDDIDLSLIYFYANANAVYG